MSETRTPLELPCTVCGAAAVEITPPAIGAVSRYALSKLLRSQGAEIDDGSATFGYSAAQMAASLGVRCIPCVEGITPALTPDESATR